MMQFHGSQSLDFRWKFIENCTVMAVAHNKLGRLMSRVNRKKIATKKKPFGNKLASNGY